MKKRIVSFLLALCLLCSLLPVTAFAAPSSQPVYVAFTSDVHSKTTNASDSGHSPYRLNQWLTKVSQAVGDTFDNMVFCGDNADGSGAASGDDFWNKVQTVMNVASANSSLNGNGLFLAGNHEWENGDLGKTNHAAAKNIQEVGTKVVTDNYVLYLFGASSDDQKNTGFKTEHINALDTYLSSAPTDRPIFITSHFPIHTYGSRSTKNADKMISTLNKYGDKLDLYFIWGHNHSQSDNNYDKFFDDDDKLLNTSINFVYCAAGCMSDREYTGSGSVQGKGLVAKIVGGKVESLSYYGTGYTVTKSYNPVYSQAPQEPEKEYVASGKCGNNLTWTLDEKGTLTVSGTGAMGPWEDREDVSWYAYLGQITSVVLENGVTTIGDYAFVNAEKLSSITIPRSVTQIGRDAFTFCSSLTKITLPDSITSIGDYAFYACSNLSGISIPNGVTRIGDHTFYGCRSIKKIELPENITSIDDAAFYDCSSLETVLISGVVTIDEHAFDSCNQLKSVTFESDAPTIDPLAFNGVETTCYYPAANATWTEIVKHNYGGTITWVAVCPGHKWNAATCTTPKTCSVCGATDGTAKGHNYTAKVTVPTCTEKGYTTYTCSCGDSYIDNYVAATGHDHIAIVTAPTCTEQGYTTHTCKCGDSYVDTYKAALDHNKVTVNGYAATCTEDGMTDGERCERCGTVFTPQQRISKLNHAWSDWETTREATCSQEGIQRRDCSRCDEQETQTIEKLQHQYEVVVTAPTCTAKGYTTHTCSVCKDTYTADEVKALGHNEVIDKGYAATCTEEGLSDGKHCDRCNTVLTQQKTIAALGCSFTNYRSNNDATCVADGTKTASCDRGCGAADTITEAGTKDPDAHSFGAWVTEGSKKERICALCGHTESSVSTDGGDVEIEAPEQPNLDFDVDHVEPSDNRYVLAEEALNSDGEADREVLKVFDITLQDKNNVHVQPNGTVKVKLPLDWEKDGNYKVYRVNDDGTLTDMKAYRQGSHMVFDTDHFSLYVIVEEKEHKHTYQQTVTSPTCTETGYTTYTCTCGDSYVSNRTNALGHTWGDWETSKEATCTQEGSQHRDCSRCEEQETKVIEKLKHPYETVVTAPTCTEKGYTTYTCSVCKDTYTADEIAALGHSWDDGIVTIEPTEDKTGIRTYTCETCGETETEEIPTLDHKHAYKTAVTAPTCTERGYTTYTCTCGDSYVDNYVDATGHTYEDGECAVCGEADPDYKPEKELFDFAGANMQLGNNLSMNFFIAPEDIDEDEDYYAVITMDYADNREDYEEIIEDDEWSWYESLQMHYVTMDMVAAKEMTDEITVTIYNDDDEQVSVVWVDSVRAYAMRMLANETDEDLLPLYVEILNYGAAAQEYFDYDESDLANKLLTAEQKAYGLGDVTLNSKDAEGENYAGMNLKLDSSIIVNFYFTTIPEDHDDMYAIATYIDHYGVRQTVTVEGEEFGLYSGYWYVPVSKLVVADCSELVTVKVYDGNNTEVANVVDSMENYIGRMSTADPLYEAIMRFAISARTYLHSI